MAEGSSRDRMTISAANGGHVRIGLGLRTFLRHDDGRWELRCGWAGMGRYRRGCVKLFEVGRDFLG